MANTKSISAYGSKGHYHLFKLTLNETKTNTETNKSTISYVFNLSEKSGYKFAWSDWGSSIKYTLNINSTKITGTIPAYTPSTDGTNLKTGTIEVEHTPDGSKSISFSFSVTDNTGATYTCGNASSSATMTLTKIPRTSVLGAMSSFDAELDKTLSITKYLDSYYDVLEIYNTDKSELLGTIDGVEDGDTLNLLTLLGSDKLYTTMTSEFYEFKFIIKTYSSSEKSTLIGSNETSGKGYLSRTTSSPLFEDYDLTDGNTTTRNLTQDENAIVKDYSTLKISNLQATAQKKASIAYWVINDTSYANTGNNAILLDKYSTNSVTVYAQDSRGMSTPLAKTITNFVNYFKLTKGMQDIERVDEVTEQTKIFLQGTFFNDKFGSNTNAVQNTLEVTYKYKKTKDSDWITGETSIVPTISENNYSFDGLILGDTNNGFDIANSYDVKVIVKDKLEEAEFTYQLIAGKPAMALFGNKVALGNSFDESLDNFDVQLWGNIGINGSPMSGSSSLECYPVGSIYLSINDTNPSTLFGGTWEQIAKGRTLVGVDSSDSDFSSSQKIGGEKTHTLTTSEMPSHTHTFTGSSATTSSNGSHSHNLYNDLVSGSHIGVYFASGSKYGSSAASTSIVANGNHTHTLTAKGSNSSTGGGSEHNNLQPYFTCYIWLRTE